MKIGYLEVVEVKKIRSRNVCQLIVEADISQFKALVELDDSTGVFIPCTIKDAVCGAVELDVEEDDIRALMDATATPAKTIDVDPEPEPEPEPEKPKGKRSLAQRMMVCGYFHSRQLWAAMERSGLYTQAEHYEAVKLMLPLNIYPKVRGSGDVVAHHVRTSQNAGIGMKPADWYCIPIYDSHHQHLHAHATREERYDHLDKASGITAGAMRTKMKIGMGRDSLSGLTLDELEKFEALIEYDRKRPL